MENHDHTENELLELKYLLEAIYERHGHDFRSYSQVHLLRRIRQFISRANIENISCLQHRILNEPAVFRDLSLELSINVTEMFRDPVFFRKLRELVVPELKKQDLLKVWVAGCATGEEVYSLAVLFKEEGIYDHTIFYATDFNEEVLKTAEEGIYPSRNLKKYTDNYNRSGGRGSFGDFYMARYDSALLDASLREKIVFAAHNLATDSSFGEMDLILCRNVMIYFDKELQNRVIDLFYDSLSTRGFLCLGMKESLRFTDKFDCFETVSHKERIYRREL